jgi:RHS repeat-associated protein
VTTPPSGNPLWTFVDDQGHNFETFTGAFDGSLIETRTLYDALGRAVHQSKPFASTGQPSFTDTAFDGFNRVFTVTMPLGAIDNSAPSRSTTVTTTYNGSTIQTQRVIDRPSGTVTETQLETKNAIGKPESETRVTELGSVTTSYAYDADGNVTVTTDPANNQILIGYDGRGRKQSMTDPDMGNWTYQQDGFGDLVQQIDPNARKLDPNTAGTTMTYDPLGRMLTKTNPTEGTAQWDYDVGSGAGIGKLAAMVGAPDPGFAGNCTIPGGFNVTGGNRAVKVFGYEQFGEIQQVAECADGINFATSYEYDALGRQRLIRYPAVHNSQLAVGYHYTSLGFLQYLTDESSDYSVLWQAKVVNVLGQVTDEQTQNGVETVSNRNSLTGWLQGTTATAHADNRKIIQNWSYEFDELGDLLTRTRIDDVNPLTSQESFGYDLTNRLTSANVSLSNGTNTPSSYAYDALGNLTQKDGKTYSYGSGAGCAAGPHAVCSVGGGTLYTYDADGNMTATGSRTVTYNATNRVTKIVSDPTPSQGNDTGTATFMYGADANRVVQSVTSGTTTMRTVYVGLGATGKSLFEQVAQTVNGATAYQNVNYIYAGGVHGGNAFAMRVLDQGGSVTATKYYSFDHLGSVTAMSDERGRVSVSGPDATVLAYDAWGARRNPDESAANWASFTPPVGNREFTGQEQIPDTGLVNMNGRVYDPVLGRFLSPDPNVQDASDTQSYNRYSYVLNNPLRYTDPTGYFWNQVESTLKDPMFWAEFAYTAVICVALPGAGCLIAGIQIAMFNATVALGNGAGLEQTSINFGIGVGLSIGGFAVNLGPVTSLAAGSASAAATTAITNKLTTGKWGGDDILAAAFLSAASGAVMMGIGAVAAKISQASAAQGIDPDEIEARVFGAPKDGGGTGKSLGFDIETRPGNNDYQLSKATRDALQPIVDQWGGQKVNLDDVRLSFSDKVQGFVASKNRIYMPMDFSKMDPGSRDYFIVHETTHYVQFVKFHFDAAAMDARGSRECSGAGCEKSYYRPTALRDTSLSKLNVIDPQFNLEAIAHQVGLAVSGYKFPANSWYSNY